MCLTGAQLKDIQNSGNVSADEYYLFQKDNTLDDEKLLPETFADKTFYAYEKYIVTPCTKNARLSEEQFDLSEFRFNHTELEEKLIGLGLQNGYTQKGKVVFLEDGGIKYFLNICAPDAVTF